MAFSSNHRKTVAYLTALTVGVAGTLLSFLPQPSRPPANPPRVLDDRLQLTLVAETPDIVTPIGIAVDKRNRIFVLESHTHLRPTNYKGPATDQVKMIIDDNGDGRPERISVFVDGLKEGVQMAFSPAGDLYAVTSKAVWGLYDRDGNGVCDERKKVLDLTEPASVYAHAALLGITFSPDGWLYVSRGNTGGSAWKLVGTDGTSVGGYGDGGNIVRARPDGSKVEEVATGFWNPVDLKFDSQGHLLTVDNDPDSRGPNRLVHVVTGGDYGYKSMYGGSGIHPYLAWNGELPGTLPYAVALGEAPSGLLNLDEAALPADYRGQLLSSIWEESRVVRIKTMPKGTSLTGEAEVLIEGGQDFRPVAFAADQHGAIYFTDWVLRDYPNHGHGRIWKLSVRPGVAVSKPQPTYPESGNPTLTSLYAAQTPGDFARLKAALMSDDPFVRHAAAVALSRPVFRAQVVEATTDANGAVRLGALLALKRAGHADAEPIARRLLSDPDVRIRQQALQWIGQSGMMSLQLDLGRALTVGAVASELFDTYLETVAHLMPAFQEAYRNRTAATSKSIKRPLPPRFIETLVGDASQPTTTRALAMRYLPKPEEKTELLISMLQRETDETLRLEAIRTLAGIPALSVGETLLKMAQTQTNPASVRAEALLALARQPLDGVKSVLPLLHDTQPDVRLEAARYLRSRLVPEEARTLLAPKLTTLTAGREEAFRQQLSLALGTSSKRPQTLPGWEKSLAVGGDARRGRRVFYSVQGMCSSCHMVQGRGGDLGPDLANVGRSKSRRQLIHSILRPSGEITPEWQGWYVRLTNGQEYQGRQIDIGDKEIELYTQGAGFVAFPRKEVKEYGLIKTSLMPEGLEKQLTEHDLRDLLAFLEAKR